MTSVWGEVTFTLWSGGRQAGYGEHLRLYSVTAEGYTFPTVTFAAPPGAPSSGS